MIFLNGRLRGGGPGTEYVEADYEPDADGGAAADGGGDPASSGVLQPAAAEEGTETTSNGALFSPLPPNPQKTEEV